MQNKDTFQNTSKTIFSVSELNLASQKILERHFPDIWIEGEISNLSRPTSGHIYFSLKDSKAQIRAAFFRQYTRNLDFELRNGLQVLVKACVSLYPDRGDYQLIVEKIELAGEGLLRQAYDKLLSKLKDEGLFDIQYKQALPPFPKRVGIITSPTGAALRDMLHVLQRRFPGIEVILFPTAVQGANAAPEIVLAIQRANALMLTNTTVMSNTEITETSFVESASLSKSTTHLCDVLLLARGGGSLEDLWPFNEEIVARAVFASRIPIVTGIGHETDFTIADFIADLRAPTPSAAAECVSPDQQEIMRRLQNLESLLLKNVRQKLNRYGQHIDNLAKRLRHPGQLIKIAAQRLNSLGPRLVQAMQQKLMLKQQGLSELMRTLEAVSPLATLNRGYAIVTNEKNQIIRSTHEVKSKEKVTVRLKDGVLDCTVT